MSPPASPAVNHIAALSLKPERKLAIQVEAPAKSSVLVKARYAATSDWPEAVSALSTPTMDVTADKDVFQFPTPTRRPQTAKTIARADFFKMSASDPAISMSTTSLVQNSSFSSPLASNYARQPYDMDVMPQPIRANTTREYRSDEMDSARPKLSRWRSFGGMFRKKSRKATVIDCNEHSFNPSLLPKPQTAPATPGFKPARQPTRMFTRSSKKRTKAPPPAANDTEPWPTMASSIPPHLDINIPEAQMGRYSELFSKLPSHPDRFDSLRTVEEYDVSQEDIYLPTLVTYDSLATERPRGDTEPSSSDALPRRSPLHEQAASSSAENLPHISALVSRPKPLQRHNTAPLSLSSIGSQDQQFSTTTKVSQSGMSDPETASISSNATSPTTPTWQESSLIESYITKPSSGASVDSKSTNTSTDILAVPCRSPEIQTSVAITSMTEQLNDDEKEAKPQVAIARSLSVTKAGSRAGLRPMRVNSKKRNVAHERTKVHQPVVPSSVPEKDPLSPDAKETSQPSRPTFNRAPSRKQELQRDLTREIWGQHGNFVTQRQMQEKKMLMPNLCIIQDGDARKSVYAVMDCDDPL